jgi:hypothetical protein
MVNEKLILKTLANLTKTTAGLQLVIAGMSELLASRLPNLTDQQKSIFQNGANNLRAEADAQDAAGEALLSSLRSLP